VGFDQLPFRQQWIFYAQLLFYPILILSFFMGLPVLRDSLMLMWLGKFLYNGYLLAGIRQFHLLLWLPLFEILFWPAYITCWVQFRVSSEIQWKGRSWKSG
jgi:hypothetical protein